MPGRKREPVSVIQFKGKSHHLTKEVIEERTNGEVKASADNVKPPKYLTRTQKTEFTEIADQLVKLGILSNLDCDILAMFIVARAEWVRAGKDYEKVRRWARSNQKTEVSKSKAEDSKDQVARELGMVFKPFGLDEMTKATNLRDKAFKQAMRTAGELGLTVSSRCRLVIPPQEEKPKNKFSRFDAG